MRAASGSPGTVFVAGVKICLALCILFDARDDGLARGGELVDAIGSVDDEGALGAERDQRAADEENAAGREDANDLIACVGRVGERTDEVEDGAKAESAAQGAERLHGRVIERRVEKDEAGFAQAFDGQRGRELDGHAEGFEHVCRAALQTSYNALQGDVARIAAALATPALVKVL